MAREYWQRAPIGARFALQNRLGMQTASGKQPRYGRTGFAPTTLMQMIEQERQRRLQIVKNRLRILGSLIDTMAQSTEEPGNVYDVDDVTEEGDDGSVVTQLVAPTVSTPSSPVSTTLLNYSITGVAPANTTVEVLQSTDGVNWTRVGSDVLAGTATTYSINVPLVPNSANRFMVLATDSSGNQSSSTDVPIITQGVPITAPVVTNPSSPITASVNSFQIQGTAPANALVQVFQAPGGVKGASVGGLQLAGGATYFAVTVPLNAGANAFVVTARDASGSESAPTAVPVITLGAPLSAPTVATPAAAVMTTLMTYSITGSAPPNTKVEIFQAPGGVKGALVGSDILAGTATTYSINVALSANAPNQFVVIASDSAGNQSPQTTVPTITQGAPVSAPVVTKPVAPVIESSNSYQIEGTAQANALVQVFQAAGGVKGPAVGGLLLTGGATNYSITVSLSPGVNQFVVTARDASGNESSAVSVPVITVGASTAAPTVTRPAGPVNEPGLSYQIEGTAPAGSLIQVFQAPGGVKGAPVGGLQLLPGVTSYAITVSLAAGVNQFMITARDAIGNESPGVPLPQITQGGSALPPVPPPQGNALIGDMLALEGIGGAKAKLFQDEPLHLRTIQEFLDRGATRAGRKDIAAKTGISERQILKFIDHADLFRIKGIASEFAELLVKSGVNSVRELARRDPDNLAQALLKTNRAKKLVRRVPNASIVEGWIEQAGALPDVVKR